VLRETSRRRPAWVAAFTESHIFEMSGVTFREAVRHLPPADAARLTQLRSGHLGPFTASFCLLWRVCRGAKWP